MMLLMWYIYLWIVYKCSSGEEIIQLDIDQGTLKGQKTITKYHGIPFYSFKGIPYAKPNIGRNKFNTPEPLTSWSGILDATKHGNICPAYWKLQQAYVGDEDCLYLNVYTPDIDKNSKKAVMVYIHGGLFHDGSGDDVIYGPDFLVEEDVVLVTMNYRLGVIGFLNTGDAGAPGNNGLKDQNLALKWVQKNIINFGGCPKRVTIFGNGIGAGCVHYHMLSPMSRGLFKGAILQSGSAVKPWAFTNKPKDDALKLAEILGLKVSNITDVVEKLRDIDARELVAADIKMIQSQNILESTFVPSIETDVGQDVFLSDDPWTLIKYGDIADVPMMIGLTTDESGYMINDMAHAEEYQDHLCQFIPKYLNITDRKLRKEIADIFDEFYFNKKPIIQNTKSLIKLLSDFAFNHASLLSAEIMNSRMSSSVYEYLFNYFTPRGIFKKYLHVKEGIIHVDDLVFIFYSNLQNNIPTVGSDDEKKTNEIVEMWINFAKEGDPSVTMNVTKIKWEPMGNDGKYLDIGNELTMNNSLFTERVNLWAKLYSNVLDDYTKLFN